MLDYALDRVHPSFRRFLPSVSLLSSVSILTIFLSVLSSKFIAVLLGTSGVALMGLYRSLGSTVSGAISLGYANVYMQEISVDRSDQKRYQTLAASFICGLIQLLLLAMLGIFFGRMIASRLFNNPTLEQVRDVYIVLFMTWINIGLQNIIAILRGNGSVRDFSKLQLITSVSSLVLILPLVKLGSLGLAINVASGSAVALFFGTWILVKKTPLPKTSQILRDGFAYLKRTGSPSLIFTWQAVVTTGGFLFLQTLFQKNYGIEFLGNFAAAYLIIDTATNVLMSSVRSYFLPKFGEMKNDEQKAQLLTDMINLLLVLATLGVVLICILSPLLISLLFSKKFEYAATMLVILSVSILVSVFSWSYSTLLIHKGANVLFTLADTVWVLSLLALTGLAIYLQWPPLSAVVIYSSCSVISVALYLGLTAKKYGRAFLPVRSLKLTGICFSIVSLSILWYLNR